MKIELIGNEKGKQLTVEKFCDPINLKENKPHTVKGSQQLRQKYQGIHTRYPSWSESWFD